MSPGDRLAERYEIIRELGRGGAGVTYLARDAAADRQVVVKLLHLGLLGDWKAVELFEREAAVLKQLHHDMIPAYVDFFSADVEGAPRFILVREFVDGQSLQMRVEQGWRGTEEEIGAIGCQLLGVVRYIHSLRPPVIHRDINPRNVIARDDVMRPGGAVFLLDFGGVQDAIRLSAGGASTIVGTPGYTPMEQFVGRATVRSDLYAVAATLLFLLTHRNPADLPVKDMRIDFASCIDITSPGLSEVLTRWLEPDEARRTLSIDEAVALLEGRAPRRGSGAPAGSLHAGAGGGAAGAAPVFDPARPPEGSRIHVTTDGGNARFSVPSPAGGWGGRIGARTGSFVFIFVAIWMFTKNTLPTDFSYLFWILPFLVTGIGILARAVSRSLGGLELTIGPEGLTYSRRQSRGGKPRTVPLDSVGECRIEGGRAIPGTRGNEPMPWGGPWGMASRREMRRMREESGRLVLDVGSHFLSFGEGLTGQELGWLRDAINARLREARGGS